MTVVGLDDTDSRERGMCTTYPRYARRGDPERRREVERLLLVRLNPAVEHKTRGNAALAVQYGLGADRRLDWPRTCSTWLTDDPRTNPGASSLTRPTCPAAGRTFARETIRSIGPDGRDE